MSTTNISTTNALTVKKWSARLAMDSAIKSYFSRKFIGESDESVIQRITDLDSDAGDRVQFDLAVRLRGVPVTGDNQAKGTEEALRFFTDEVIIDQMRHPVSAGGRMTRKRTRHQLREVAKNRLSDYWGAYIDEMMFVYLSGDRGDNLDYIQSTAWAGHAGNPIQAPDAAHIVYGGDATSFATIDSTDKMTKNVIEKAATKASMMQAVEPTAANMNPVSVAGEGRYVCVMSDFHEHDMRTADTTGWMDIQKAAAGAEGRNNPIFQGSLGMIKNVVLHSHQKVVRFNDAGAGSNVAAGRALFLGRQAGVVSYGTPGGMRFQWQEEMDDYDNLLNVNAGTIIGVKKTRFNSMDFGVIAIDTACANPNA